MNVRTMCLGPGNIDLDKDGKLKQTARIDAKPTRLNVNIVALQETRLAEAGSVKENTHFS